MLKNLSVSFENTQINLSHYQQRMSLALNRHMPIVIHNILTFYTVHYNNINADVFLFR